MKLIQGEIIMYDFFMNIAAPTVWVVCGIELLLLIYSIYKSVKTKSIFIFLVTAITFGLFYDAFITSLGTVIDAASIMFLSRLRYILHVIFVPLLFIITILTINVKREIRITVEIITLAFIILGIICIIFTKYEVINFAGISRLVVNKELTNKAINTIPTVINIIAVLPSIGVGIYKLIKEKNAYMLLSGGLMFLFPMIGPILKLNDFLFLISMFGEICMIVFLILYFNKVTSKKRDE